jgi:hypothetical protein
VRTLANFVAVLALAALTAREASAQPTPRQTDPNQRQGRPQNQRPYRGIFGGGHSDTEQSLTLGLNFGGGFDTSVLVDNSPTSTLPTTDPDTGVVDPGTPSTTTPASNFRRAHGSFAQGSANLNYSLGLGWIDFAASAGTAASYYPVAGHSFVPRHFANAGTSIRMGTRAGMSANYSVTFQPVQHLVTLPGVVGSSLGPTDPFESTLGGKAETYRNEGADVALSYRLTKRLSVSSGYGYWRTKSPNGDRDFSTEQASAHVAIGLRKDLGMYVGYRLGWSDFGQANLPRYTSHNVDVGLNFHKALSLTRNTSLSFGTGTVGVTDGTRTTYSLTGNIRLEREIGRSWRASLSYARDVQFVQTFRQPVFSDSVWTGLSGMINPRLRFDATGGIAYGSVGFSAVDNGYKAYFASAGVNTALTRYLSGGVRYSFTRYSFGQNVAIPNDLLFQSDRHGVNVYLSSWLPLFTRTRRP